MFPRISLPNHISISFSAHKRQSIFDLVPPAMGHWGCRCRLHPEWQGCHQVWEQGATRMCMLDGKNDGMEIGHRTSCSQIVRISISNASLPVGSFSKYKFGQILEPLSGLSLWELPHMKPRGRNRGEKGDRGKERSVKGDVLRQKVTQVFSYLHVSIKGWCDVKYYMQQKTNRSD